MTDHPNLSTENQPKGSARNPSETLDRHVGDSREVTGATTQGEAMSDAAAREPGQREANLDQDRREAANGDKPAST